MKHDRVHAKGALSETSHGGVRTNWYLDFLNLGLSLRLFGVDVFVRFDNAKVGPVFCELRKKYDVRGQDRNYVT